MTYFCSCVQSARSTNVEKRVPISFWPAPATSWWNTNRDAQGFENQGHLGAHVLRAVHGGNGEVAALDGGTVAAVATFELGAGVPGGFVLVDFVKGVVRLGAPAHAVEDEEFWLGTEVGCVTHARGLQVGFRTLGDGTWVT